MITFPTTAEAFIAYQEAGIHRELDTFERELSAVIVELINVSYQEGMEGRANTITMDDVSTFYQERGRDADFGETPRIWECICWWCSEAYRQGKEAPLSAHMEI